MKAMDIDWNRVARFLESEATKKQDEANAFGVDGQKTAARMKDESAYLLRALAAAIKFGLQK